MNAFLSGTFGKVKHRQRSERLAGAHAPAFEDFRQLRAGRKHGDRQGFEKSGFLSVRHHRYSEQRARHNSGRLYVRGYRDVNIHSQFGSSAKDSMSYLLLPAE